LRVPASRPWIPEAPAQGTTQGTAAR
jgi:hypothetical protein